MTIQMSETDVLEVIGAAVAGGVVLLIILIGLFIYLLVRPPRRQREAPPSSEAVDSEQMLALIERMERRLATLERAVEPEAAPPELIEGGERPMTRRKQ